MATPPATAPALPHSRATALAPPKPPPALPYPTYRPHPAPARPRRENSARVALSRVESLNAQQAAGMLSSAAQSVFLGVTLRGPRIPRERLERGIKAAQRVHRVLQTSVGRDSRGTFYLVADERVDIPVIEVARKHSDQTWRTLFENQVETQPMLFNNPGCSPHAVYLVQDDDLAVDDRQVIVFLHHFICDGPSVIALVHLILKESLAVGLNERLPEVAPWTVDCDSALWHALRKKSFLEIVSGALRVFSNASQTFGVEALPMKPFACGYLEFARTSRTFATCEQLSEVDTQRFMAACKARGASVTGAVLAAALKAAAEHISEKNKTDFSMAGCIVANTRKPSELPDEILSNGASAYMVRVSKSQVASIWTASELIKRIIVTNQEDILYYGMVSTLGQVLQPSFIVEPTICISSWCPKSPLSDTYSSWKVVDAELLQNSRHVAYPLLSLYTVANRLHMSLFCQVPRFDAAMVKKIMPRTKQILIESMNERDLSAKPKL